ncbi:helix-turn-helix domain-containing protein [Phytoactinopolyspora halotolerans]|uniref:Helix-turn-helix transcriptional regulator n=1 Tax=Phytoactinopolyspora halotolerans TaxID=1981512 RepID=A0A6L9SEP5_9ACTN|nr:XRE family transcriptional regulator [Phytoactinopolyspora halotolerans]NEE02520.1 helix-turn-helix transcriptional regulator [Phytoactinopolyspora halotolerans]
MPAIASVLADVGPRLKRLRTQRGVTLAELAERTGISKSTLSRLESGQRRPSLELLLPISMAHQVPLDELIAAPRGEDPRIRPRPRNTDGRTILPLTRQPAAVQAYKITIPPGQSEPDLRVHDGYEWMYVLSGRLRLRLAEHDLIMGAGEAAEFDTRVPHWFGSTGAGPVEILSLFGQQGERMHVRAKPRAPGRRSVT